MRNVRKGARHPQGMEYGSFTRGNNPFKREQPFSVSIASNMRFRRGQRDSIFFPTRSNHRAFSREIACWIGCDLRWQELHPLRVTLMARSASAIPILGHFVTRKLLSKRLPHLPLIFFVSVYPANLLVHSTHKSLETRQHENRKPCSRTFPITGKATNLPTPLP